MIKVAHITAVDISLRYLLLNQLKFIIRANYHVTSISSFGPNTNAIEEQGIKHIAIPISRKFSPLADLMTLWRLYKLIKREEFVIVHTHTPKPSLLGQMAAKMAKVPIIINTIHGFYFHDNMIGLKRRFYILMEKIAALCSNVILSQNPEDIDTAIKEKICHPTLIKLLGNGIDLTRFNPKSVNLKNVEHIRNSLGITHNKKIVGFVGRLVAEKGFLELLDAAKIILATLPNVVFLIIGPTDSEKQDAISPSIVAETNLHNSFIFTGLRQDMPELYKMMDVFTLPSHREGFPRSGMEASAMGIPCVMTNIRGCRQVVQHGRNGLLVPYKNPQKLAEALLDLLLNPIKAEKMGKTGIQIAKEQFDETKVFEKVLNEYERLLLKKGISEPSL